MKEEMIKSTVFFAFFICFWGLTLSVIYFGFVVEPEVIHTCYEQNVKGN